jgi:hypothetical protein
MSTQQAGVSTSFTEIKVLLFAPIDRSEAPFYTAFLFSAFLFRASSDLVVCLISLHRPAVRELNDSEVLHNVTKNWSSNSMYKFVFQPRPQPSRLQRAGTGYNFSEAAGAGAGSPGGPGGPGASSAGSSVGAGAGGEDYELKLKEQKARMNRLSVRMTNRKSQGLTLTNQDKLREMKVEQIGKRLTLMHQELEAAKKLAQQADEFERRKKVEEDEMRKKASDLETRYKEMEMSAQGGGPASRDSRASITPEMQKQLDDMRDKRKQTEDRLAQIEAQMAAKRRQRRDQAAITQQKQVELMEAKLRSLEAELEKEESKGDVSEDDLAKQAREMEREQAEWEQQRQAEMRKRQAEFEKERSDREGKLKLQQDEMESKIKMVEQALAEQARKREAGVIELKQRRVGAMENRLRELEKQLAAGEADAAKEIEEAQEQLSVEQSKIALAQKEKELKEREARLELLFSKVDKIEALESMVNRLQSMPMGMGMGMGMAGGGGMSMKSGKELKEEIEELQKILMDGNKSEKEIEEANIKLEKALDAYEKTPECLMEIQKRKEEWVKKNEPLNKAAFQKMSQVYNLSSLKNDPKTLDRVKKYPELRLLMMNQDTILKKHESDFKTFVLNGLSEDELRAIRSVLPKFRNDQKAQVTFLDSLDTKIEEASKAAAQPKPQVKKSGKKFVAKKVTGNAAPGDLFAEMLAKKSGGGGLKAAPPPSKSSPAAAPQSFPPLPPPGAGGFPPLPPPGPAAPSAPSAPRGPSAEAKSDFGALKNSLDALLNAVMNGSEKDIAAQTRNTVTDLKKLAASVKTYKPDDSQKLEQMASLVVIGVKEALAAKKTNEMEFVQAQSKLARINEKVKKQASDAVA